MGAVARLIFLVLVVVLILMAIAIGIQNGDQLVNVFVLKWSWSDIPLVMVMIECIAFGMFLTIIIGVPYEIRMWLNLRAQRKEMKMMRAELDSMRNLPLSGVEEEVTEEPAKREQSGEEEA
jgi:uncharacterized membrane protein YciS (DUF1049 family)